MTDIFIRREKNVIRHRHIREECRAKLEAETEMFQLQAKGHGEVPANDQKQGKGKERVFLNRTRPG